MSRQTLVTFPGGQDWAEFMKARDDLLRAARRVALAEKLHKLDESGDVAEACDRADMALALAARSLVRETDKLRPIAQPSGWSS